METFENAMDIDKEKDFEIVEKYQNDSLASKISENLEECEDLHAELIPTVQRYSKEIVERYTIVKHLSKSELKHSRMLMSLSRGVLLRHSRSE